MAKLFDQPARCPIVVGRDAPLAVLDRIVEQVAGGHGQTLLVAGEAGIGKSRLVAEARSLAERRHWLIVEGHSFEPDRILPYAPLLDLLSSLLADLSPPEVTELLGAEVRDLARILPELVRSPGDVQPVPGLDLAQERRLIIQAFAMVMLRLSSRQPVLVIIEDLHWSDETSLDALLHLARRISGSPLLLVMTYRDDEVSSELRHVLATVDRERLAVELALQRLDATDVGAMVSSIVAGTQPVRPSFRDALHSLTDGNPFFIEEVLNALRWGDDTASPHNWLDQLDLDALHVPRSVHDAVHRRVERLSPDARHVLHLASVAGRRCDFSLLEVLTGHREPELLRLVRELVDAQLLVEESEDRFAFRHALTQKAVYTSLLSRERRRLHLAIAEAYEQRQTEVNDRHMADLAYHCYEAGEWSRALDYALRAGEQAMELYAPQAAIEQFSRALDAAQRLSRSPAPNVYRARGRSYETLGDFTLALADYEAALNAARVSQDQRAEWQALLDLGLLWAVRDYEQSAEYCQRALARARTMADPVILAHSLNRVGNWYTNIARPHEGLALHREALSIVEESGDRRAIAETLDLLGVACYVAGNHVDSARYYTAAIERFDEQDDRQGVAWCLSILALCGGSYQTDAGVTAPIPLEQCERYAQRAIQISSAIEWRPGEAFARHVCGMIHTARGQYDRGFDYLCSGLAISEDIGHRQWTVANMCSLGVFYLDLLDADRAITELEKALSGAHAIGSRLWVMSISPSLAGAYLLNHDLSAAQSILDAANLREIPQSNQGGRSCWLVYADLHLARGNAAEARRIADALIASDPHLTAERDAPRLARLRGETLVKLRLLDEAEDALRAAIDGAISIGLPSLGWRAQVALGRLLRMQRRHGDAEAMFAEARTTIERLASTVPDQAMRQRFLTAATAQLPPPRQPTARRAKVQAYGGLTEREREVAIRITQGLSNRDIAEQLFVSEPTVASHVSHILAKLHVNSRTQVATWALDIGLLNDE